MHNTCHTHEHERAPLTRSSTVVRKVITKREPHIVCVLLSFDGSVAIKRGLEWLMVSAMLPDMFTPILYLLISRHLSG